MKTEEASVKNEDSDVKTEPAGDQEMKKEPGNEAGDGNRKRKHDGGFNRGRGGRGKRFKKGRRGGYKGGNRNKGKGSN